MVERPMASVCNETKAFVNSVLNEDFWQHLRASKREARAAARAIRRAVKRQFLNLPQQEAVAKQKIEIV